MLFKKQIEEQVQDEVISCGECKCLIKKEDACKVNVISFYDYLLYYCRSHKKPYNTMFILSFTGTVSYYGKVQMTKEGTPIGYIKDPKAK